MAKKLNKKEKLVKLMDRLSIRDLDFIKNLADNKIKESITFDLNAGSELPF
jgi:hypothetical protein